MTLLDDGIFTTPFFTFVVFVTFKTVDVKLVNLSALSLFFLHPKKRIPRDDSETGLKILGWPRLVEHFFWPGRKERLIALRVPTYGWPFNLFNRNMF